MAFTAQDLANYHALQGYNNADGGRGTMAKAKKGVQALATSGFDAAKAEQLQNDPAFMAEYAKQYPSRSASFFGGLLDNTKEALSEQGLRELALAVGGGIALGATPAAGMSVPGAAGAGAGGTAGLTALPAGGMTATGVDAIGMYGSMPLPAGGMTATGGIGMADAAAMGVGGASSGIGATAGGIAGTAGTVSGTTNWLNLAGQTAGLVTGLSGMMGGDNTDPNAARLAADPFAPYRGQYAEQLNKLMSDPSSVTNIPGYEFVRDQGEQGVVRKLAAQGKTASGNEMLALQEYNQGLANQMYNQEANRLATYSGAAFSPAAGGQAYLTAEAGNRASEQAGASAFGQSVGALATNPLVQKAGDNLFGS